MLQTHDIIELLNEKRKFYCLLNSLIFVLLFLVDLVIKR